MDLDTRNEKIQMINLNNTFLGLEYINRSQSFQEFKNDFLLAYFS